MTLVKRQNNESVERLISRFRRQVIRRGSIAQVRNLQYHKKKPSKRLVRQQAQFRQNRRKEMENEAMGLQS